MFRLGRILLECAAPKAVILAVVVGVTLLGSELGGQSVAGTPYRANFEWAQLPDGREWGRSVSGVHPDPDGRHIWVLDRCGDNCAASHIDPLLKFDLDGNLISSMGAGLTTWPHGLFVDHEGNVWVTDGAPAGDRRAEPQEAVGKGQEVLKLSAAGEVLMTLGTRGVAGNGPYHFNGPTGVVVDPHNGNIFVADGHGGGNNRIVRFSSDGEFVLEWGGGSDSERGNVGRLHDPHGICMDSQGRVLVADRLNFRVQVFDQEGTSLERWTQFGRPDWCYVDANDMVYVTDSHSNAARNPGWQRGIRVADAKTGWVKGFLPDLMGDPGTESSTGAQFAVADAAGSIYGAQLAAPAGVVKWVQIEP